MNLSSYLFDFVICHLKYVVGRFPDAAINIDEENPCSVKMHMEIAIIHHRAVATCDLDYRKPHRACHCQPLKIRAHL